MGYLQCGEGRMVKISERDVDPKTLKTGQFDIAGNKQNIE